MGRLRLYILALLLTVPVGVDAQNIYLLSVGVANYPGTVNDLYLAADDAIAMHKLYQQNTNATSILLTNSLASKSRILSEANILFSNAKPDDIVVFFFSGHGGDGGFYAYDGLLSYEEVRRVFSSCRARNKMIFADACFAGDMRENTNPSFTNPSNNVMLFLSSRSREYSNENPRTMRNGMFAACLLRSLKGGADINRDRVITAKELYTSVRNGVVRLSENKQHPVMWGNFADTMPVMIWK
jgi:uncharacterized caspase-like protein